MFDRTAFLFGGSETHHHTTVVQKAPTEESVRLLKELEEKAEKKIEEAVRLSDNTFDVVCHSMNDMMSGNRTIKILYEINRHKRTVLVTFSQLELEGEPIHYIGDKIRKELSNDLAQFILDSAIRKQPGVFDVFQHR